MNVRRQAMAIWLRKASNDWLNVQNNLASDRIPWDTVCFHAQQTIEKLLKALLVCRGIVPHRSHDLLLLFDASPLDARVLRRWRAYCRELNSFAVLGRYEGEDPRPAKARSIVRNAGRLREAILERIESKSAAEKEQEK